MKRGGDVLFLQVSGGTSMVWREDTQKGFFPRVNLL